MGSRSGNGTEVLRLGDPERPGYEACTGCSLCRLPCPVWRQTGDPLLTLEGRALALQGGAPPEELADSLAACVVCGACEPACPENIDTVGMTLDLRALLGPRKRPASSGPSVRPADDSSTVRFLPGAALRADETAFAATVRILGVPVAADDGTDLVREIESGHFPAPGRQAAFVQSLAGARELVVAEGLLHRSLRKWLPGVSVTGLGEALLKRPAVGRALRPTDLYVIETRGYHADFARLVNVYTRLREETGCSMNLDLQRIAIPTGAAGLKDIRGKAAVDPEAQARWMLEGRKVDRIVVECVEDRTAFRKASRIPVVHVSELATGGGLS